MEKELMNCMLDEYVVKPPLGTAPYYVAAQKRILSLAQAIDRYASVNKMDTGIIKKWAEEIVAQCDLMDKLYDN